MSNIVAAIGATEEAARKAIGAAATGGALTGSTAAGGTAVTGSSGAAAITGVSASFTVARTLVYESPVAVGTAVQGAQGGNLAQVSPTPLPGAVTQPNAADTYSHSLLFTFGATWALGNNIVLTGTNAAGASIGETVIANPGGTAESDLAYATVVIAKQAVFDDGVGNAANIVTTTIGSKLGTELTLTNFAAVAFVLTAPPVIDSTEAASVDPVRQTIEPATPPDGTHTYLFVTEVSMTVGPGTFTGPAHTHTGPSHTHGAGTLTT